ncbi:hypothetical protein Sjap_026304 [Stephania japonica]|uniref:Uncharacterized protein n=1 Tax=Stephania japonica TaxID=461633 RepID=A0AAP0E6F6_9MAGN
MTFIDTRSERFYDRLQRRCQELTCATPDQSVDDEAVYLNVAGECPKGRVYGLGSLGRKKRRYADPGASTSEMPDMVPRAEFNVVAEQLRKVMEFMQQHLGMNMDGAGLSQQQPPPPPAPPPHDQQQLSQIDPIDPPQQGDNVERETRWSGSVPRRYLALYVVQDCSKGTLKIRDGLETEFKHSVAIPSLIFQNICINHKRIEIVDGYKNSVSNSVSNQRRNQRRIIPSLMIPSLIPFVISNGIRDGLQLQTHHFRRNSISVPFLISVAKSVSNQKRNYSVFILSLIRNGINFPFLIESATTFLETELIPSLFRF